jgi:hypothetical protein
MGERGKACIFTSRRCHFLMSWLLLYNFKCFNGSLPQLPSKPPLIVLFICRHTFLCMHEWLQTRVARWKKLYWMIFTYFPLRLEDLGEAIYKEKFSTTPLSVWQVCYCIRCFIVGNWQSHFDWYFSSFSTLLFFNFDFKEGGGWLCCCHRKKNKKVQSSSIAISPLQTPIWTRRRWFSRNCDTVKCN